MIRFDGRAVSFDQHSALDDVDAARALLQKGEIVAVKGMGGFHLACDVDQRQAVARLRQLKSRERKPFALMAANVEIMRRYCAVDAEEERLLGGAAAPIVLLRADGRRRLPKDIAGALDAGLHAADHAAARADARRARSPGGSDQWQCRRRAAGER